MRAGTANQRVRVGSKGSESATDGRPRSEHDNRWLVTIAYDRVDEPERDCCRVVLVLDFPRQLIVVRLGCGCVVRADGCIRGRVRQRGAAVRSEGAIVPLM